ncbi:FAD-binding oxidoreductase [Halohasta litorea]|uniref:FAD-binding oxidoreductase n=1 Tax=Halohasta litorea TaxID=869891 RepID=A0ABD6D8H1_9EURY|nr:FAD-binding oxidoreductase [Halohasta litorea]
MSRTAPTPNSDSESTVTTLRTGFRGDLILPDDEDYDDARAVWNGMIDKYPAVIARCAGVSDVMAAVDFGREQELPVAVRGGGHHIAGNAVCDDGIVVDCSQMRSVVVDPKARTARVEAGALLADVDHETQAFGLAVPTGINSTTGIAGLTLGGGGGWLSRKYGMTIDNLRSVDLVTADGEFVHASEETNPDLFWAVRGGSGNFGVVTNFEFDLHPVGPEVLCGPLVYAHEDAREVMRFVRDFNRESPEDCVVWLVLRKAPPLPFLDESVHGTNVLILVAFYAGEMVDGEAVLAPLREFGTPIADAITPHQYTEFQQSFDPLLEPGARNYWKSHNFAELSDEAIDIAVDYAADLPTELSEIFFGQIGGATERVDPEAMAYPHRETRYMMNVHTRWEDPAMDDDCIQWARKFFAEMAPHATGGVYVNFISEADGEESLAYRDNYARLAELKAKYDPDNVFRVNQNVEPAPAADGGNGEPATDGGVDSA